MLGRKGLLIVLNNVVGAGFGFLALNFIASMPVGAYGYYVWAGSTIGIFALVNALGFNQAHIKRVSQGVDEARANGTYYVVKVVLTLAFVVVVALPYVVWRFVLGRRFTDSTTDAIFLIVLIAYTVLSFRQFYDTTFLAHRHTARGESVLFFDTIVSFTGIGTAYYLIQHVNGRPVLLPQLFDWLAVRLRLQGPVSPETAGALIACAYLGGRMVSLVYSALQFHVHKYPVGPPSMALYRDYRRFGLPLAIVSGIVVLYGNLDRFLLGIWWNQVSVENFQVTYQVLTPMLFVALAVGNLLFPSFSSYEAEGDRGAIRRDAHRAERYISMLIVPQGALAFVFAREGMNIFNARFIPSAHLVQIFVLFVYLTSVVTPSRSILLGTGQTRRILYLVIVNLVLVLGLNVLLVHPRFLGMAETGAALVVVVASLFTYGMTKVYTRAYVGGGWLPDGAVRHAIAGVLTGFVLYGVREALGPAYFVRLWQLALVGAVGSLLYLALLVAMREFRRQDWDFLRELVHPKKLAGYVGQELAPKSKP